MAFTEVSIFIFCKKIVVFQRLVPLQRLVSFRKRLVFVKNADFHAGNCEGQFVVDIHFAVGLR